VAVSGNRLKGVSVGKAVAVDRGVGVWLGSSVGSGVQVAGRTPRGVGVRVGMAIAAGSVGGGKGLRPVFGFMKIRRNTPATKRTKIKTNMVRIFHTTAGIILEGPAWSM